MPSLQIRQLPDDLYQRLALRAEREHRSLAQQALVDLRNALEAESGARRRDLLGRIRREAGKAQKIAAPEDLIREDRER